MQEVRPRCVRAWTPSGALDRRRWSSHRRNHRPALPQPILPPVPSEPPTGAPTFPQVRVFVRAIRVTGSTVFSQEDLAQVTAPYVNREVTTEDLEVLAAGADAAVHRRRLY